MEQIAFGIHNVCVNVIFSIFWAINVIGFWFIYQLYKANIEIISMYLDTHRTIGYT